MSDGSRADGGKSIRELIDKVRDATKNADLTVGKVAEYADTGLGAISVGKDLADVVAGDYSAVQTCSTTESNSFRPCSVTLSRRQS